MLFVTLFIEWTQWTQLSQLSGQWCSFFNAISLHSHTDHSLTQSSFYSLFSELSLGVVVLLLFWLSSFPLCAYIVCLFVCVSVCIMSQSTSTSVSESVSRITFGSLENAARAAGISAATSTDDSTKQTSKDGEIILSTNEPITFLERSKLLTTQNLSAATNIAGPTKVWRTNNRRIQIHEQLHTQQTVVIRSRSLHYVL